MFSKGRINNQENCKEGAEGKGSNAIHDELLCRWPLRLNVWNPAWFVDAGL
jgi:hypothetical protein